MDEARQAECLQGCINDLVALLALPAVWSGRDLPSIVRILLDGLLPLLRLDFAYALVKEGKGRPPVEIAHAAPHLSPGGPAVDLACTLADVLAPHRAPGPLAIPNPLGEGQTRIAEFWLGLERDAGRIVFAAARPEFPTEVESLLLRVGVNLLTVELQHAQVRAERSRADESHRRNDHLHAENSYLRQELASEQGFGQIVGQSEPLREVLRLIQQVAPTQACVLIEGETGTGKELVARAIHRLSARRDQSFVKLNCAAVPMGLLESELFGHERGAFTGAVAQRLGRFEIADKGTIFLDEVGEIPVELQAKLLRVLQEQEFERLGSSRTLRVDVRVIAASNRNLAQMVRAQQFRSDLYYRLRVFPISVPPLRTRAGDVALLARHFMQRYARRMGKPIYAIPGSTLGALAAYAWPGNIRELENLIERSVILSSGPMLEVPLGELVPGGVTPSEASTLEALERDHILRTLDECGWVIAGVRGAARKLGMKRTTLQYRMQKLGIQRRDEHPRARQA